MSLAKTNAERVACSKAIYGVSTQLKMNESERWNHTFAHTHDTVYEKEVFDTNQNSFKLSLMNDSDQQTELYL